MGKLKRVSTNKVPSRRQFLKAVTATAGAVAFPYIVPSSALGLNGTTSPSDRITIASIGVGGQGKANLRAFLNQPDTQVVALCDVDTGHLAGAKEIVESFYKGRNDVPDYKGCDTYADFREVLARPDVDAVCICTPDHWHAVVSIAAAEAGKDMYCEKPLANTIAEGRAVVNAMKRYGRVFQTGSHERSRSNARYMAELVQNGRIGKLHTIKVNMPIDHFPIPNQPLMEVPKELDYDMWLGPAPWAPYTEKRCHFFFRYILDYSGGEMSDRGAHILDLAQFAHGTSASGPISIKGRGDFPSDGIFDTAMKFELEYEYADGVKIIADNEGPRGLKFIGSDGWIFEHVHGGNLETSHPSLLKEVLGPDEIHLGRTESHHRNFLQAVYTRTEPFAQAEYGHRSATMCHMANIAMKIGRKLQWDPEKEQFVNDDTANSMLARPMRGPWGINV
ncbi:MAG: dehydrogenase [Candidatus Hydrogenedentota bacterium]